MPVSLEFIRGIVGVIGVGCAYMTGRAYVLFRKGLQRQFRFFGWIFRTALCMIAVGLRHSLDTADIATWALAAIAFGLAVWQHLREKPKEDLTHTMFPPEDE